MAKVSMSMKRRERDMGGFASIEMLIGVRTSGGKTCIRNHVSVTVIWQKGEGKVNGV